MNFTEIKKILSEIEIPDSLDLSPNGHIFDLPKFIKSHIQVLEGNSGNKAFRPYYNRLVMVVKKLTE